jgi:hypothetical protein
MMSGVELGVGRGLVGLLAAAHPAKNTPTNHRREKGKIILVFTEF